MRDKRFDAVESTVDAQRSVLTGISVLGVVVLMNAV
jgi:hypothetical protein